MILSTRAAIIFLSGTLAFGVVACSSEQSRRDHVLPVATQTTPPNPPQAQLAPTAIQSKKLASSQPNNFDLALDKAFGAISISQSAQSSEDWYLVANQWQEAIALLQTLPNNSPYKGIAKSKISQYQRNLTYAQQRATRPLKQFESPDSVVTVIPGESSLPNGTPVEIPVVPQTQLVFQAVIKRRVGKTPVIDVTFNGTKQVEMILDTGASGTVLTEKIASALQVVPITTTKADTASAKGVEFRVGYVSSIEVGGAIVRHIPVAIAPASVLETGLLGHDFFDNYDITIKRDIVEFRSR